MSMSVLLNLVIVVLVIVCLHDLMIIGLAIVRAILRTGERRHQSGHRESRQGEQCRFPKMLAHIAFLVLRLGGCMLRLPQTGRNAPLLRGSVSESLRVAGGKYPSNPMLAKLWGPFRRSILLTRIVWRGAALAWLLCPGIGYAAASGAGNVDAARLQAADSEPQNWFTGGRDKDGTYFSPLTAIDAGNVKQLGFAWSYDLGEPQRGQEATPLVIDGVMYTSGTWGYVYAVAAASGKELWRYDPKADFFMGRNPCCDLVNRGVAVWKGKVFVASVDGRLHALDAASGKKLWEADTIVDPKLPYSSTGAPQIAGSVVVIGNSGADMGHGAGRGYISAYDLEPARSNGVSSRSRRQWASHTKIRSWLPPTRPGIRTASLNSKAARPPGMALRTMPNSTCCTSARPMPLPMIFAS
jgi:hypothetical protein